MIANSDQLELALCLKLVFFKTFILSFINNFDECNCYVSSIKKHLNQLQIILIW